jgi:hypothetical protein
MVFPRGEGPQEQNEADKTKGDLRGTRDKAYMKTYFTFIQHGWQIYRARHLLAKFR